MDENIKLTLVEQALQSSYSRQKLDQVSLRQFINRLLLLTQKPRIFLFYKKYKNRGGWVYSFSTHGDVLYEYQFKQQILDKLHIVKKDKEFYQQPKEEALFWPTEPQQIGQTSFGIILVAIDPFDTEEGRQIHYISPLEIEAQESKENTEYQQMEKLWENFLNCNYSRTLGIRARLEKRLQQIHDSSRIKFNNINLSHKNIDLRLSETDSAFIQNQLNNLTRILDKLYTKVYETPLISSRGKIPPNLFFFVRYYDRPETINRFEDGSGFSKNKPYPYSLKMILPPAQKEHLREVFENILKNVDIKDMQQAKKWPYYYQPLPGYEELFPTGEPEYNSPYPDKELDLEFWSRLKSKLFDHILSDIQIPFGKGARSFVDPAFMTGFTHFRFGLYEDSGLERVTEEVKKQGFGSADIRRLVYLHYIFSAAAPDSNYETLGSMTVPLNVAEQPFVALVRATISKNQNNPDYQNEISWPQNYLFFTEIAELCMRELRKQSRQQYKKEIEKLVFEEFKRELKLTNNKEIHIALKKIEDRLNHKLTLLCRVWPYPLIQLTLVKDAKGPYENFIPIVSALDPTTGLFFTINNNPFFLGKDKHEINTKRDNSANRLLSSQEVKTTLERALGRLEKTVAQKIRNVMHH